MTDLAAHHAAVTVSDLDRAVAFYRAAFGLSVADRFEVSGEAFATAVGVDGAEGSFVHLDAGGARVELVTFDPQGEHRDGGQLNEPGTSHVGLETDDVDAVVADLPEAAELVSEPQTTASGARVVFLRDPDGNLVELLEP